MQYQTHWRLAFVLAFFFHIIAWLFLTILIPHVFKALEAPPQEEPMEWVELADDPGPPEEEQAEEPPPPPPPQAERIAALMAVRMMVLILVLIADILSPFFG